MMLLRILNDFLRKLFDGTIFADMPQGKLEGLTILLMIFLILLCDPAISFPNDIFSGAAVALIIERIEPIAIFTVFIQRLVK